MDIYTERRFYRTFLDYEMNKWYKVRKIFGKEIVKTRGDLFAKFVDVEKEIAEFTSKPGNTEFSIYVKEVAAKALNERLHSFHDAKRYNVMEFIEAVRKNYKDSMNRAYVEQEENVMER